MGANSLAAGCCQPVRTTLRAPPRGGPGAAASCGIFGSLINEQARVSMVHVPCKGAAQINTDLLGQHVDSAILTTTSVWQFVKEGSVRALSLTDSTR